MNNIEISNVGPIEAVSIPVPAEGGVVVLRGPNGAGKTIALSAVDALTRDGKATPAARARDGSLGGSVQGLGRTIKVGLQRSTVRGELEVSAIGDDVDVAALVDPGLKDPAAADRARIKAALLLARIGVDVAPFADLVGGLDELRKLVRADALAATDPVEMAERIRRDLNAAALTKEREADAREGSAKGLREAAATADLTLDEKAIRAEAEEAAAQRRELVQRQDRAEKTARARAAALAAIDAAGEAPDLAALSQRLTEAHVELASADAEAARARATLEAAEKRVALAKAAIKAETEAKAAAEAADRKIAEARKALETLAAEEPPSKAEMDAAGERVVRAHAEVQKLGAVEEARKQVFAANVAAREAEECRKAAASLRDFAKGTDEVLAQMIARFAPAGLTIFDGRLVVKSEDGRQKFFADLSDGQRWAAALDMAIDALGDARILAISQVAWEGLDSAARAAIHAHAKARQTVIVTAEADHGDMGALRAEEFDG